MQINELPGQMRKKQLMISIGARKAFDKAKTISDFFLINKFRIEMKLSLPDESYLPETSIKYYA